MEIKYSILHWQKYIDLIKTIINNTLENNTKTKTWQLIWEMIKINIKETSIEHYANESITKTKAQQEIQKQLDSIHESIIHLEACSNLPDACTNLQRCKEHISELESKQILQ